MRNRTTATRRCRRRRWPPGRRARGCSTVSACFIARSRRARRLAQRYFDQGMRFIWAFNHDEATRSFAKAALINPRSTILYQGRRADPRAQLQYADDELGAGPRRLERRFERAEIQCCALRHRSSSALIAAVSRRYRYAAEVDPSNSAPLLGRLCRCDARPTRDGLERPGRADDVRRGVDEHESPGSCGNRGRHSPTPAPRKSWLRFAASLNQGSEAPRP